MDFKTLIEGRYSARRFSDQAVPEEMVKGLIQAARVAPTAHNYQPFHIYNLKGEGVHGFLNAVTPCDYQAPVNLVLTVDHEKSWKRPDGYDLTYIDAGIVGTHIMLMAEELGLGCCWIADLNAQKAKLLMKLSTDEEIVSIFEIGFKGENLQAGPGHGKRKDMAAIYSEIII